MAAKRSSRREIKQTQRRLRATIRRADEITGRCLRQLADGDLRWVDRETAEKRAKLGLKTISELEQSLARVEEALASGERP